MTARKSAGLFVLSVLLVGIAVGLLLSQMSSGSALAQGKGGKGGGTGGSARYDVVHTEGHNLIVTDNGTNTLYFYTTDKDQPVGSPLHLRGSLDLTQVGGQTLTPTKSRK
jgi:hypothetical protein